MVPMQSLSVDSYLISFESNIVPLTTIKTPDIKAISHRSNGEGNAGKAMDLRSIGCGFNSHRDKAA